MKLILRLAAVGLLVAVPAWAATGLEASRAGASTARQQVLEVRGRQMALRKELNALAPKIAAHKSQRQGKLLRGAELEAELRRSQELSGALTSLAQTLSAAEADAERENEIGRAHV